MKIYLILFAITCSSAVVRGGLLPNLFEEEQFWLSFKLHNVDWEQLMSDVAPFLNDVEKEIILDDALFESVNPLILISILSMEHDSHVDLHHESIPEFSTMVLGMAKSLVDSYGKYEGQNATVKGNVATSAVWEMLDKNYEKLDNFLKIYSKLYNEHVKPLETSLSEEDRLDRASFILTWPWPTGESWKVGGTHGDGNVWSALDIYDGNGRCKWNKTTGDVGCIESTPMLLAMHSGKVSGVTQCNLRITHSSGWATNYYHMDDIKVRNGEDVSAGQEIGRYAGKYNVALCSGGRTTGPHLHLDFISKSGRHENLDGMLISGYKIKAGTEDYDKNCRRCNFKKDGKTFCPYDKIPRYEGDSGTCFGKNNCKKGQSCDRLWAGGPKLCQECKDIRNDCKKYESACTNPEYDWFPAKCRKTCKVCDPNTSENGGKGVCTDTPSESAMAKGWTCQTYVDWGLNLGYYCRKAEWKEKQICGKVCGEAGEPTDPDC